MAMSAGHLTFICAATIFIALVKQADQPAASNCSGLVSIPAVRRNRQLYRPSGHQSYETRLRPGLRSVLFGGIEQFHFELSHR